MTKSELRREAKEAKLILGHTGTVTRVTAFAIVYRGYMNAGDWVVEAPDSNGDDGTYITVFSGPNAQERALEYAGEKYCGVEIHADRPRRQ